MFPARGGLTDAPCAKALLARAQARMTTARFCRATSSSGLLPIAAPTADNSSAVTIIRARDGRLIIKEEKLTVSEQEEDFATMFEASARRRSASRGDRPIEGTIVAIGPEVALVNVGGKSEAVIDVDELKDEEGNLEVAVGDRIQALVVSTQEG